jgi:hypothetical protein
MSSDDLSLWEAELAGVRPLGAKSAPRRKGEASRAPAPAKPLPAAAAPTPVARPPDKPSAGGLARAAQPAVTPQGRAAPPAAPQASPLERALGEAQVERDALRAQLAAVSADRDAARAELVALRAELEQSRKGQESAEKHAAGVDRRVALLEGELKAARAGTASPNRARLGDALQQRGLNPRTEADMFLRAVADARLGEKLVEQLLTEDKDELVDFLIEDVALNGGCPACPRPTGRAIVDVPRQRCDVCSGSDIQRTVKDFVQTALLAGMTKVVVVGGSAQYRRTLRELVPKERIRLTLVPGDKRRLQTDAREDLRNNDLVVVWGATELNHAVSENYTRLPEGASKVWTINHRGIAGMLTELSARLQGR